MEWLMDVIMSFSRMTPLLTTPRPPRTGARPTSSSSGPRRSGPPAAQTEIPWILMFGAFENKITKPLTTLQTLSRPRLGR